MTAATLNFSHTFAPSAATFDDFGSNDELQYFDDILNDVGLFLEEDMLLNKPDVALGSETKSGEQTGVTPDQNVSCFSSSACSNSSFNRVSPTASVEIEQRSVFSVPNPFTEIPPQSLWNTFSNEDKQPTNNSSNHAPALVTPIYKKATLSSDLVAAPSVDQKPKSSGLKKRRLSSVSMSSCEKEKDISDQQMVERR